MFRLPTRREAIKDFLEWALTDGQSYFEFEGLARLAKPVAQQELKVVKQIP